MREKNVNKMRRRIGKMSAKNFTLVEIAVAIAVFAIGILTAMGIMVPAVRWGADAKNDFTAAEAASSLIDQMESAGDVYYNGDKNYPYFAIASEVNNVCYVYRKLPEVNYGTTGGSFATYKDDITEPNPSTVVSRNGKEFPEFKVSYTKVNPTP